MNVYASTYIRKRFGSKVTDISILVNGAIIARATFSGQYTDYAALQEFKHSPYRFRVFNRNRNIEAIARAA